MIFSRTCFSQENVRYAQTITIEDAYRPDIGGSPFHMDIAKLVKEEFSIMQMVDNSLRHSSIVSAKQNPTNSKQIILTVAIPSRLQLIQIKQPIYIYNKIICIKNRKLHRLVVGCMLMSSICCSEKATLASLFALNRSWRRRWALMSL